jgi:hypothetical protein
MACFPAKTSAPSALEQGEVEYVQEPLDPPDEGWALICCSKPKSDVVLEL